jgi:hypothetical protein
VRPINENESLSWPTAKLSDGEGGRIKPTELTEGGFKSLRKKSNQWFGSKLRDAVETHEEKNWPTPKARDWKGGMGTLKERQKNNLDKIVHLPNTRQDQEKSSTSGKSQESWGTPKEQDSRAAMTDRGKSNLGEQAQHKTGKKLNPNWVEQLMGLPVGWTQLPTEWTD